MPRVFQCDEVDFDEVSGTCAAPYFGDAPSVFPTLSIADAKAVGVEIAVLWAIAFGFRQLRNLLQRVP